MYTPSELYSPTPMLTQVLFLYPDKGYASKDAAQAALTSA